MAHCVSAARDKLPKRFVLHRSSFVGSKSEGFMIILFDVDGVLVENRAYRAGIERTTQYFSRRLGLQARQPTDHDIDVFEAESITVEWDSCAIVTAALLLERLQAQTRNPRGRARLAEMPRDFWQFLDALPARA